jgi:GntR family transcriptional regulator
MAETPAPRGAADAPTLLRRLEDLLVHIAETGATLPAEPALAAALTASRPALREALVRLEERGYIARRQGTDTVINRALLGIPVRIDEKVENARLIDAMGKEARVELLALKWDRPTSTEIAQYGENAGTEVLRTTKVWYADDLPVIVADDVIPVRNAITSRSDIDARLPVFDIAELLGNPPAEWETVWLTATLLGEDAERLNGAPGDPALGLDVIGVTRGGTPGYWAREKHLTRGFRYAMVRSLVQR